MTSRLATQDAARPAPRRLRRRVALVIGALALAFAVPAMALAVTATFTDVPPTHAFYKDVERMYAARITTGCSAGKYCPSANVTRGQMAAFLGRTGGLAEQGAGGFDLTTQGAIILAEVTIKPGAASGGTVYVQLVGTFGAYTQDPDTAAYPYKGVFAIADKDGGVVGYEHYVQIESVAADEYGDGSGAVQVLVEVPTNVAKTYQLVAQQLTGTDGLLAGYGTIQAAYFPFSDGGGWVAPAPQSVQSVPKIRLDRLDRAEGK